MVEPDKSNSTSGMTNAQSLHWQMLKEAEEETKELQRMQEIQERERVERIEKGVLTKSQEDTAGDVIEKMGFFAKKNEKDSKLQEQLELKFARDMTTYQRLGTPWLTPTPKQEEVVAKTHIDYNRDRWFTLTDFKNDSDVWTGVWSFKLLRRIWGRNKAFHITIPPTLLFGCGSESPIMIESENNRLKFSKMEMDNSELKQIIASKMVKGAKIGSQYPLAIVKSEGRNRIIMDVNEFDTEWPGSDANCVLQKYIVPRGLKSNKTRVIINENKPSQVFIFCSKTRWDNRKDLNKHHQNKIDHNRMVKSQNQKEFDSIGITLINYKNISKGMQMQSPSTILSKEAELIKTYSIFKDDPCKIKPQKKRKKNYNKKVTMTQRFLTHHNMELCDIYEGNIRAYKELENIVKELKQQVCDKFVDKMQNLKQFVVDFIQDSDNNWYFLKIKYGKTVAKYRPKSFSFVQNRKPLETPTRKIRPKLNCSGDYWKVDSGMLSQVVDIHDSPEMNNHIQAKRITSLLKKEPIFKGYYKIERKKILEHRSDPKSSLSQVSSAYRLTTANTDQSLTRLYDRLPVCGFCYKIYAHNSKQAKRKREREKTRMAQSHAVLPSQKVQSSSPNELSLDSIDTRKPTAFTMTTAASRLVGTRSTKRIVSRKRAPKRKILK